jgi:CDP-diacylglycerol---glycerol-3-phosphate 3-phosphatidyltransferase
MNIPTALTLSRLFLIPIFVLFFYLPIPGNHIIAALIFVLAAITDFLDGILARNFKQITKFGAFLDPVVDKVMVVIALLLVVGELDSIYLTLPVCIIVGREIIVSALREWMAEIGKRTSVAVGMVGKIKTTIQMVTLILLLLYKPGVSSDTLYFLGLATLYLAAILTLWSMVMYLRASWPDLWHRN